ncbi:hypothetical protein HK099_001405, partial [Clydaea vesicula]
ANYDSETDSASGYYTPNEDTTTTATESAGNYYNELNTGDSDTLAKEDCYGLGCSY